MTLITPNGVFLIGVIDGAPVYTAWSRRADSEWLADQLDSVRLVAGSDVHESSTSRTANQHADPSAGGDDLSLTSPPMGPVRLSLAAFRRIRRWLA